MNDRFTPGHGMKRKLSNVTSDLLDAMLEKTALNEGMVKTASRKENDDLAAQFLASLKQTQPTLGDVFNSALKTADANRIAKLAQEMADMAPPVGEPEAGADPMVEPEMSGDSLSDPGAAAPDLAGGEGDSAVNSLIDSLIEALQAAKSKIGGGGEMGAPDLGAEPAPDPLAEDTQLAEEEPALVEPEAEPMEKPMPMGSGAPGAGGGSIPVV